MILWEKTDFLLPFVHCRNESGQFQLRQWIGDVRRGSHGIRLPPAWLRGAGCWDTAAGPQVFDAQLSGSGTGTTSEIGGMALSDGAELIREFDYNVFRDYDNSARTFEPVVAQL